MRVKSMGYIIPCETQVFSRLIRVIGLMQWAGYTNIAAALHLINITLEN